MEVTILTIKSHLGFDKLSSLGELKAGFLPLNAINGLRLAKRLYSK
jgi:hypothetical protein